MEQYSADIYVSLMHAPFITVETMRQCIEAVCSGGMTPRSAQLSTGLLVAGWQAAEFRCGKLPRTQDLKLSTRRPPGLCLYKGNIEKFTASRSNTVYQRSIFKEAVDIDWPEDFTLAESARAGPVNEVQPHALQ
jgi:hypothetical protein